jgi:Skp family chaperone for outer membrane proteins
MSKQDRELVIPLGGNLFRVHNSVVDYADGQPDQGGLKFINPRRIIANATQASMGLDKESMDELREALRTEGLQNPLTLNGKGNLGSGRLVLLNGERRKRCLDKLVKDNVECYDQANDKWVPAAELYEYIECRIHSNINIKQKYKHAFSGNDKARGIGEGATIALVKMWRTAEEPWSDEDIMQVTGKSITWLRDTDLLINLDATTFEALVSGGINRTVALELAKEDDPQVRLARFHKASTLAAQRMTALIEKTDGKIQEYRELAEQAEADLAAQSLMGTAKGRKSAQQRLKREQSKLDTTVKNQQNLQTRNPQVTRKDLDKADSALGTAESKMLTFAKIEKHWYAESDALLSENADVPEGIFDSDLRLVKLLWEEGIQKGERDIVVLLQMHRRNELSVAR